MAAADTQWFEMASFLGEIYSGDESDLRLATMTAREGEADLSADAPVFIKSTGSDGRVDPSAIPIIDDEEEEPLPSIDLESLSEEQLQALAQAISPQPVAAVA